MKALIPVLDTVNLLPAVKHSIREFLRGEPVDVHLLHFRSPFMLSAASWLTGRKRHALHRGAADKALKPARALLERFHVPYAVHLESGDKAEAINAVARRVHADCVVLGTARHGSATGWAEASVIQRVLDSAPVPVVLVAGKSVSRLERYGVAAGLGATLWLILFG